MKTLDLLEAIKSRYSLQSDYAAAKFLGIRQQTVSGWRQKGVSMDDEIALSVADKLGFDRGVVLAWVHAERSKVPAAKRALEALARRVSKSAAAVISWGFITSAALPALLREAAGGLCILCQIDTPKSAKSCRFAQV